MERKGRTKRRLTSQSPCLSQDTIVDFSIDKRIDPHPARRNTMGYDKLEATQLGRSSHLRFGPTLVTALLLGLALGVAVPASWPLRPRP